jgi:guanylate cyclase
MLFFLPRAADPEDLHLNKNHLVASSLLIGIPALLWGILYLSFGKPLAAAIPISYTVLSFISVTLFALIAHTPRLPDGIVSGFFVMSLTAVFTVTFLLLQYFVRQKDNAFRLLYNVLPREIAPALKEGGEKIAQRYNEVSILFADIGGFTGLSEKFPPVEIVPMLNEYFSHFDSLCDHHGVAKICTVSDNFMAACGVPVPKPDHAQRLARMALEMCDNIESRSPFQGNSIRFGIGINSGAVVAGAGVH